MKRTVWVALLAAAALRLAALAGAGEALTDWGLRLREPDPAPVEETAEEPVPTEPMKPPEETRPPAVGTLLRRLQPEEAVSTGEEAPEAPVPVGLSADVRFHDSSGLSPDLASLCAEGLDLRLDASGPQVLIFHTHSSEAYSPDELDPYEASDPYRTEDKAHSVIRVGDELAAALEAGGLRVLHDREIYDWPSYTGSYTRSGQSVERYLTEYPSLRVVIDLHRDAIGSGDTVYRTRAALDGVACAQVMLLAGTGANGLSHPLWKENLKLALYLQNACEQRWPSLMRPLELVKERYNQQLCTGMLILEVGSTGNSLQEAIRAARLFGEAAGPALAALIE